MAFRLKHVKCIDLPQANVWVTSSPSIGLFLIIIALHFFKFVSDKSLVLLLCHGLCAPVGEIAHRIIHNI